MLAPIIARSSLRSSTIAAIAAPSIPLVAPRHVAGITTKAERWTQQDVQAAALESPEAKVSLKDVVPQIEARWSGMSKVEQYAVYRQLEEIQRKDWKELTLDEKKAAYFVSFGPHGPRRPITPPGQAMRTAIGVSALLGVGSVLFFGMRHYASPPPKTMTKEYQEQSNENAREVKLNPITGISSENYKGKGFVQSK